MTIAFGVAAKGAGTGTTVPTNTVTTQATGSTFIIGVWIDQSGTLGTPTDSKGNTYIPLTSELDLLSTDSRMWVCVNGTGGASHSATGNFTSNTVGASVTFIELIPASGFTAEVHGTPPTPLEDSTSPYVSPSITTTVAATMLASMFVGNSGSNPATHAESTGFSIPAGADVTDGTTEFTGCLAYRSLSSTTTTASSFTESGGGLRCAVHIAAFEEISTGPGVPQNQLAWITA